MALFPFAAVFGIAGLVGAMIVLDIGINAPRSPFHPLLADGVPSAYRSDATGSFTFQMCVGMRPTRRRRPSVDRNRRPVVPGANVVRAS
jgi:hypothetical protein